MLSLCPLPPPQPSPRVLLPFAAQQGQLGACRPTQSDEAACQHLGEGGSDPPSWSRLLFQVARTVSAARLSFCLVRIASYHVCLVGETTPPPYCLTSPARKCCQGDGVMTAVTVTAEAERSHGETQQQLPVTTTTITTIVIDQPFSCPQETRGSWELGGGRGGEVECGQIRFVPQKVSMSRRFLVLVASVTCHLMPNATMSTWEVPVTCFPSAPVRTQRSTRGPSWVLQPVAYCGLMNAIYSAPNHLHERHRSRYLQ